MINLNEINAADVFKKRSNVMVALIILTGLIISLRILAMSNAAIGSIQEKIRENQKTQGILANLDSIAKTYSQYQQKIFFTKDSAKIVDMINEWAQASGVEIISLRPLSSNGSDIFLRIPIELEAVSDYYNLGQFLGRIESYEGFMEVVSLRVSKPRSRPGQENNESSMMNFNLSLNVLSLKNLELNKRLSQIK
jgi:Tfp pilus assembly protein PilO